MTDVVIIGGGIVGAATAVHLLRAQPGLDVLIVEPDPSYALASTPRASGGVRQLFSRPENIAMSRYTLEVIAAWPEFAGAEAPDLLWRPQGYLFIAAEGDRLWSNLEIQLSYGVRAEWLDPAGLAERFPWLAVRGLAGGVLSPDDGWLDPSAFLYGMLHAATSLGARTLRDRVAGFDAEGTRVSAVVLESGRRVEAEAVVNAAGCWAPGLAAQLGVRVPVEPVPRYEHYVEAQGDYRSLPFVKDPAGLAIRPQGDGLSVGLVDFDQPASFDLGVDGGYFDRSVWPALAHRVPALDALRLRATTAGLYDQNRLDGNLIIGRLDNFHLACGFSGHGMMHAPAVGRALSELVLHGEYRSIDLANLDYGRVPAGRPYPELGIR